MEFNSNKWLVKATISIRLGMKEASLIHTVARQGQSAMKLKGKQPLASLLT